MTVLELVVVLGIVAGATAMAAASMPKLPSGQASAGERLTAFVHEARLAAVRSGQSLLLEIGPGAARSGERRIDWVASELQVFAGGQPVREYRAVVSPEGIIAGPELSLEAGGHVVAVAGVYRGVAR